MLGFPLPNPRAVATPPLCDCQWGKNRLFCFKIRDLSMGHGIKNTANAMTMARASAARPRTMCDPLGNDKTANDCIGNLGNAETDCPNCQCARPLDRSTPAAAGRPACQRPRAGGAGGEAPAAPVIGHEGFAQTFFLI